MINHFYSSVSNGNLIACNNKQHLKNDPIPLLRNNFLSEYRTALEKAKVRANLGIADSETLYWGNIQGDIQNQTDLAAFIKSIQQYSTDMEESVVDVKTALDFLIAWVKSFASEADSIEEINNNLTIILTSLFNTTNYELIANKDISGGLILDLRDEIESVKNAFEGAVNGEGETIGIYEKIENIENNISTINGAIELINNTITNISDLIKIRPDIYDSQGNLVDKNALTNVERQATIHRVPVLNSEGSQIIDQDGNLVWDENEEVHEPGGLYVKDLQPEIDAVNAVINEIKEAMEAQELSVEEAKQALQDALEQLGSISATYDTLLPDSTTVVSSIGGISSGTRALSLKGKTFTEIFDAIFFPATSRNLIYPSLTLTVGGNTGSNQLISALDSIKSYSTRFDQGDSGGLDGDITVTFNGSTTPFTSYFVAGQYTSTFSYKATVKWLVGDYIIDSRGNTTTKRVEAGSTTKTIDLVTTMPWYAGIEGAENQQSLVKMGSSGTASFNLSTRPCILLPGTQSSISNFTMTVNGSQYPVNLAGWTESTIQKNGVTYKKWKKNEDYVDTVYHTITVNLKA